MFGTFLQKLKTDRSGSALVFTLLVTAVMFILAVAVVSVADTDSRLAMAVEKDKTARYAAESFVELIKADLQATLDTGGQPPEGRQTTERTIGGRPVACSYTVTKETKDANRYTVDLECTVTIKNGEFTDYAAKDLTVVLEYTPGPAPSDGTGGNNQPPVEPPPVIPPPDNLPEDVVPGYNVMTVLDYAMVGGSELHLTGSQLSVKGPIFSNSSIQLRPGINITGPVKAVGTISGSSQDFPGVEIIPNQPPVSMPVVDWVYIEQHATEVIDRDASLNAGADVHDGGVILVKGDLVLTGEVSGDALLAATGNVIVYGDFGYPSSDNRSVGIIAGGNVNLISLAENQGDDGIQGPRVKGFVMAGGNIITQGEAGIRGSLIAGNQIQSGSDLLQVEYIDGQDLMETGNPVYEVINKFGSGIIKNYGHLHLSLPVSNTSPPGDSGNSGDAGTTTSPGPVAPGDSTPSGGGGSYTPSRIRIVSWTENN